MNDPKQKETQQELFEEFSAEVKKPERFPHMARTQKPMLVSTNTEQLLMAGILSILVLCGVFFLGVIRGKALSRPILAPVSKELEPPPAEPARKIISKPATGAPPAEPAQPPPTLSRPYTIQLVTHRKKEFAESEMNALRTQGVYSFIIPSGEYFQVCAGQYASKEEAKKDLARFAAKFKDCFLRRR